jgi:hypothetical protein
LNRAGICTNGWGSDFSSAFRRTVIASTESMNVMGRTSQNLGELGNAYAVSGNRVEALKLLEELKAMSTGQYVSPLDFVFVYTGLGDKKRRWHTSKRRIRNAVHG